MRNKVLLLGCNFFYLFSHTLSATKQEIRTFPFVTSIFGFFFVVLDYEALNFMSVMNKLIIFCCRMILCQILKNLCSWRGWGRA